MNSFYSVRFTGLPGSGQSVCSAHLHEHHGFEVFSPIQRIREHVAGRDQPTETPAEIRSAHEVFLRDLGRSAMVDSIFGLESPRVSIDGLHVPAYEMELRKRSRGVLIALLCIPGARYTRSIPNISLLSSPKYGEFLDAEEEEYRSEGDFLSEEAEEYRTINSYASSRLTLIEMADYHVNTNRPVEVVKGDIDRIVGPLLASQ